MRSIQWACNGDEERKFALRLLFNMRYIDLKAMGRLCEALHRHLWDALRQEIYQAIFVNLGGNAKNGAQISRYYKNANNIPDDRFLSDKERHQIRRNGV